MSHFNLGKALDDKILSEQAIASYRECIRINPNYDKPYLNIGTILAKQSRFGEALGFFGQTIRFNPRSSIGYSNYGAMLHALGRSREGVIYALKALEIQPNYLDPLANLVTIYSTLGQFDPAIQHAQRALEISPGNTQIRLQLAELLVRCNRIDQAVEQYRELNRQDPNMMSPLENLAVLLATAQQDSLRNGAEAFQYAQKVCQLTNWSRPESLDTLGAALAELRRFNEAIAVAAKAEQLAKSAGNTGFAEVVAQHIESYKVSAPLRLQLLPAPTAQPPAPTSAPAWPK
jgi:tetratricopeptide (TPR) repeat protein